MPADSQEPLYHVHTHPSGAEFWRHVIEIAAFIVAAGWAFYVFIYQERIKPAETLPQQQFNVTISHQPVPSGAEFVSLTVEIRNVGTVPFRPAGYVVAAYGVHYLPRLTQSVRRSLRRNVTTLSRSLAESKPDLLQSVSAMFSPFGSTQPPYVVAPGGDRKAHFGFAIPRNKYDAVALKYKYCSVWSNNTRVYNSRPFRDPAGAYWFAYFPETGIGLKEHIACGQDSWDLFPI